MPPPGKWIDGIVPSSSVCDAARLSLRARFEPVERFLPLAAFEAEHDVEHVHRLRVSTRRAMAAIDLYEEFLPAKRARWLRRRLKRMRRASGAARDLDVLAARISRHLGEAGLPLQGELAKRRTEAQPSIVAMHEDATRNGRFHHKVNKLLDKIRPRRRSDKRLKGANFGVWAEHRLLPVAEPFFAAQPDDLQDLAALHQFRICGKQLRYAMELLASAFEPPFRKELYPEVEQLQQRLGKINDHFTGAACLSDWLQSTENPQHHALLRQLLDKERAGLDAALCAFAKWWTAERSDDLRRRLMPAAQNAATAMRA